MTEPHSIAAVFADHAAAEAALRKLADAGIPLQHLSVVGKGCHTEEQPIGFYNLGDRVMFWGKRGAFWGGLWGWFAGGVFLTVPVVGQVVVLGYLAAALVAAVEGAAIVGGMSALAAAIYGSGIPKDSVLAYEAAVKADGFLILVNGSDQEIERARAIRGTTTPRHVDVHLSADAAEALATTA